MILKTTKGLDLAVGDHQIKKLYKQFRSMSIEEDLKKTLQCFVDFYYSYHKKLTGHIQKNPQNKAAINQLIRLSITYNEMVNYSSYMIDGKFYEAYQKQKSFINNQAFQNMLFTNIKHDVAEKTIIGIKLNIMLSILCFMQKQDISHQTIEEDYQLYNDEIKKTLDTSNDVINKKLFLFVKAFEFYIKKDYQNAQNNIGCIYEMEMQNAKLRENPYLIPMIYNGTGYNAYVTMPLPNDFKMFVNENMIEKESIKEKTTSKFNLEEETAKLFG